MNKLGNEETLNKKNIYYIVGIKNERFPSLKNTTINKEFCGRIVKITENNTFFKLNGSEVNVIIPTDWIEYLAPSKLLWNK